MSRKKYRTPEIKSERVFSLTSQACTTNGDPSIACGASSPALMWEDPCPFLIKTVSSTFCSAQTPGSEVQFS